jgi:hypothetical protein
MAHHPPTTAHPQPVHAFKPSNGTATGTLGIATSIFVIGICVVAERSVLGLRVGLISALAGLVVWMVLLRPRVRAYPDQLQLRNMASDTWLPLAEVDTVVIRHTLNVWIGDRRYTCPGLGRSSRSMSKQAARGPRKEDPGQDYATFAELAIEDLARSARRDLRGKPPLVRREWAYPELAGLAVLAIAVLVSFVVL